MIEQQLRDGLRAAVTQEPPLGFDPDDLVTRTSRATHRRRTTFAAVAAAALVVAGTVGVVAATGGFGKPQRAPVAGKGAITATTPEGMVRQVGESFAARLPEVHPGATNFEVRTDAAPGRDLGMVIYDVGEKHFALAYTFGRCLPASPKDACPIGGQVQFDVISDGARDVPTATVTRDDVGVQLGTADTIEAIDSVTHFFASGRGCECPASGWTRVPKATMRALLEHAGLELPERAELRPTIGILYATGALKRTDPASSQDQEQRNQLEREQAELERQLEKERESAEPGGK